MTSLIQRPGTCYGRCARTANIRPTTQSAPCPTAATINPV